MNSKVLVIAVGMLMLGALVLARSMRTNNESPAQLNTIRYVAIGDSYTIGEGVEPEQRWPNLLVADLKARGVAIELVANPSRTGWTTADAIERELPIAVQAKPTFATVLLGVNDWVQGIDAETFRTRLVTVLDELMRLLPNPKQIVVVTIPDFGATPTGAIYSGGRDISKGIAEFNAIITEASQRRGLPVVDIYPISQQVPNDPTLVASDGLHPSAKQYELWEQPILEASLPLLLPEVSDSNRK